MEYKLNQKQMKLVIGIIGTMSNVEIKNLVNKSGHLRKEDKEMLREFIDNQGAYDLFDNLHDIAL